MPKKDKSSKPLPERGCGQAGTHRPHVVDSRKGLFKCPGGQKAVPVTVPTCKNPLKHRGHTYFAKKKGGGWVSRRCPGKK